MRKIINKKYIKIVICLIVVFGTIIHFYWLDGLGWAIVEFTVGQTTYAPGYREYKFRRIRVGMTEEEVIEILGRPPGKSHRNPDIWFYAYGKNILEDKYPEENLYTQRIIEFDNGNVINTCHHFYFD